MEKLKVICAMDGNGHFQVATIHDRIGCIKILKRVHDGDYWYDTIDAMGESPIGDDYILRFDEKKWRDFLRGFYQRGTVEEVEIDVEDYKV